MQLLTIHEVADLLRASPRTVDREIAAGRLGIVRIRRRRLIEAAELDRYIAENRVRECQSDSVAIAGKFDSALAAARALSNVYRQAQPAPTRSPSKLRSGAARLKLHRVGDPGD